MSAQAVIVVVQDNPFVREMICDWLRRSGHVVHGVPGERAALRLLEQKAVDIVIVDLNIHRVDGLSMVRSVQSKLGTASLILTASTADYEDVAGALSPTIPIVAMGKPYSFYTLEQVVKAALVHGRLGSEAGNDGLYAEGKCCGDAR